MESSIYLKRLIDKNVGPLTDLQIDFPFFENGDPKPLVLVGENGTGKSTVISNIVDAFYEMAGEAFTNARQPNEHKGDQYFKAIIPSEIHEGASFMYSFIAFAAENSPKYIFKAGKYSVQDFKKQIADSSMPIIWEEEESYKGVLIDKKTILNIWGNNVLCYFGPNRYEKPVWMRDKYFQTEDILHPTVRNSFDGILKNQITVQDVTSPNLQWLLDIIADSRADIKGTPNSMQLDHIDVKNLFLLKHSRENLETVLSKIIGYDVYFKLNYRNVHGSRFRIVKTENDMTVCPTLDSLSTGQIALFNLFATIVRYADNNDINQSIHLDSITGIVIIDEIELHLHSRLHKEVLPELIKLFPKIQFIITTHAPLFLIGMQETFGEDGFEVIELPTGNRISTEMFSEFQRAYEYFKETKTYQDDISAALKSIQTNGKAIIVTEGSTDWKHLKAAYENLSTNNAHRDLFDELEFEFFEYESAESSEEAEHKLKMGNSVLMQLCENMAKLPQTVKYIFLADCDDASTNKKLSQPNADFKNWGNNVYSFILPIPTHRATTPAISIEHYYTDDEIKTEWYDAEAKTCRRLFLGNEFDERGIAQSLDRFCENKRKCGSSSIEIIEGSKGEKVTCISNNDGINDALPKSKFAKMILEKQAPFDSFGFESFIKVFQIIKDIIADNR